MAVDAREKPINIKKLTIENPDVEKKRQFDPKVDIPKVAWDKVEAYIKSNETFTFEFSEILRNIAIVDQVTGQNHLPEKPTVQKIEGDRLEEDADFQTELRMLAALNIAYPGSIREYAPNFTATTAITQFHFNRRDTTNPDEFILEAISLVPDVIHKWNRERWGLYDRLKEIAFNNRSDSIPFTRYAVRARIIFPEKFVEFGMPRGIWNDAKNYLNFLSTNMTIPYDFEDFSQLIRDLTILSADEVKVDEDGMHLVYEEKETELDTLPPLPQSKKY